ncbi:hypothetical protein GCM10020331_097020 [Ectobacillus funiculus]
MWEDPEEAIQTFIEAFKEVGMTMIHPSTMEFTKNNCRWKKTMHQLVRKYWDGVIVGVGDLDAETAEQAITEGTIDIAAFGRPLLSNPNFLHRVEKKEKKLFRMMRKTYLQELI